MNPFAVSEILRKLGACLVENYKTRNHKKNGAHLFSSVGKNWSDRTKELSLPLRQQFLEPSRTHVESSLENVLAKGPNAVMSC